MFIRPCYRKKNGKRHAYWALVESYRTERGPRQRTVAYLGQLDEAGRLGVKRAAEGNKQSGEAATATLGRRLARAGVGRGRHGQRACREPTRLRRTVAGAGADPQTATGRLSRKRTIPKGKEDIPWSMMAQVLVICRLCNPSSELHIAEHYYRSTAMTELLGVPAEKVNDDRLYRALDKLLPHKEALEKHLKNRLGELFDLEYDLLLVRRDQHLLRGRGEGQSAGPARLFSRQTVRLQAGLHRPGGVEVRHAAGLRSLRRATATT